MSKKSWLPNLKLESYYRGALKSLVKAHRSSSGGARVPAHMRAGVKAQAGRKARSRWAAERSVVSRREKETTYQKALRTASGIRCPTAKSLMSAFRDLTQADANKIRKLCKLADAPDALEDFVRDHCPETQRYVMQMYNSPYNSGMWRRTVVLDAINHLVGGYGVEALGPNIGGTKAPPYEYINTGDTYNTTLIYRRSSDNLFIGTWGDIAEKHPNW
jgi:hypothetical protein